MYKYKGSAIHQYAIIIFLVALAIIPVIYLLGKNIVGQFEYFSQVFGEKKSTANQTSNSLSSLNLKAGSLGGTPDQPVQKCSGNDCVIDFGEFVLQGVPQDFGEYLQTHSTSGGTDKLVNLLLQMAEQLEEQGLNDQASEIRDIANLGHFIAQIENYHEESAKECGQLPSIDQSNCLSEKIDKNPPNKAIPENVAQIIPNFAKKDTFQVAYELTLETLDIGSAIHSMKSYNSLLATNPYLEKQMKDIASTSPSNAIAYKYLQVMNDPKIPDSVKNVATSMLKYINDMALEQVATLQNIGGDLASGIGYLSYDFETGKFSNVTIVETEIAESGPYKGQEVVNNGRITDLSRVFTPQYSAKTNLSSALICVSGKHYTTGKSCYDKK